MKSSTPSDAPGGESLRTVVVAFCANLGVAVAKSVAAVVTGSASMVAEAAHSWADTGNEIFLLVANKRGSRGPDRRRPLGYGREAYVWSLLAAIGLFVAGSAVSVWHGITSLLGGESSAENYTINYVVLAVAFVLEGISFLQSVKQIRGEANAYETDFLDYALETSDPTLRAVFAEDAAALIGLVIAAAGIGLHQLTGSAVWDALGSIAVGVLLGVVAIVLIDRNRRFLTGEPGPGALWDAVVSGIEKFPEVASVRFVRIEFVGPKQIFVVASVDLVGDAVESSIAHVLRRLESRLESNVAVVDAVFTVSDPDEGDTGTVSHRT
ncbi:cation diffusion facilitator family transporter [Rhodococcus sp. BP-252]|uniref:Cation diffusion facilitator family transporter n=1 Tax=Rhodococcoides kyotonense TaxID=398843 RepID=A0A177Y6F0_9NOCA|nr:MULTISPECIES: cation diffusion facilitator family transporter [Rhodococcus]NIL73984.1 Zinc transporter ZitB [Rhodococcus sp. B10]MBY6410470.1 cation diffusion facilitator family transporter [Rhodococcus sp. BP-320]MBY6416352.1 cation diffusion facilitator family transporter [Rhodococcus sp. BP-321]MBY6420347.1 cation diffusion facilitator family transporter [Rhodococcus sp. BP-324]MBY6425026.1 cation diffusion facilitator family transporter [Rhodococcus sp. BP-323]